MPDCKTLVPFMNGNKPESILECLNCLHDIGSNFSQYRLSIVYGSGRLQVSIGDDLELVNPDTYKVRPKRWWECAEEGVDQLRLPFPAYQYAQIDRLSRNRYADDFELRLQYTNDAGKAKRVTTSFNVRRGLVDDGRSIKAIRIHRLERQGDSYHAPFYELASLPCESSSTQDNSRERCVHLLSQAVVDGIVVTRTSDVYNRLTGELIGNSFQMTNEAAPAEYFNEPRIRLPERHRCSVRMIDGENYDFYPNGNGNVFIDSDYYEVDRPDPGPCPQPYEIDRPCPQPMESDYYEVARPYPQPQSTGRRPTNSQSSGPQLETFWSDEYPRRRV